jgi:hypothetical protein
MTADDGAAPGGEPGAGKRQGRERKSRLLRLDPAVHEARAKWAADDLRSLNGQLEFVLRRTLQQEGRLASPDAAGKPRKRGG